MNQNRLLRVIIILIALIAVFHVISYKFYLYDELWWVDVVMHFLGGFWITLFSLWIIFFSGFFEIKLKKTKLVFTALALALSLLVGIIWEIFEYKTGITSMALSRYWPDTILDLIMDVSGAIAAAFYCSRSYQDVHI